MVRHCHNSLKKLILLAGVVLCFGVNGWGQSSTQNFGTTTGSHTSQTGSTTFIPNPTSGTTWTRAGATAPNAPINLVTASNPLSTTGAYVRSVASTSGSVTKFSPIVGYTGSTEFYTSFKVLFGDASASNTASSGIWTFYQGTGAIYSDANDFTSSQVFTGLRFTYGASGVVTLQNRNAGNWNTTGLTTTSYSQATVYTIEIVGNNKSSGTINYTYNGISESVAINKFDLFINGTLVGDDIAKGELANNSNISSTTFIGISSTSNVANIFVDDVTVYNTVPATIGSACSDPTTQASSVTFSSVTQNSMTVSWTRGGTPGDGVIVVARAGSAPVDPVDGTAYTANAAFVSGTDCGSGSYVVFLGSGTSVNVTGLSASTTYYFEVFEKNCAGTSIKINTTSPASGNQATTAPPTGGCASDLIISEYIEGLSNNKYLEIYNGTGSSVDLAGYDLVQYNNGSGTVTYTLALSGTLVNNDVYVIENSSEALGVSADLSTAVNLMTFNGDDVLALRKSSVNIDVVGVIGSTLEPGADVTLRRKSSVFGPTTTYSVSEWDSYAANTVSGLGSHVMACNCTAPTTQASQITISNIYSTQLTVGWTNGDGTKRIVYISNTGTFTDPTNGTDPAANTVYSGAGQQVIYNGIGNAVTVSGLTQNTTYYFRVYEANCNGASTAYYTVTATNNPNTGTTNSTAPPVGATTFNPGDLILVGFDTNIGSGGFDMLTVASFVPIGTGTKFIIANLVYEYEDAANVSTNRWYRCSADAGKSQANYPNYLEITYNGTAVLPAGTVFCITLNNNLSCLESIQINGSVSTDFSNNGSGEVNMSSSDPDAVFLMQGTFSAIQTIGSSYNYRTFSGNVLGGIQSRGDFQPFSVAGNNGGPRVSRIHPDLDCLKLNTGGGSNEFYQYYYDFEMHVGSQHALLNNIFDMAGTWAMGTGTTTANEVPTCGVTFTITSSSVQGKWTGESNEDWFNCANWDCFSVPDSLTDVTVNSDSPSNHCKVDITAFPATAARYGNLAKCRHLTLSGTGSGNYRMIVQYPASNKLKVFGNLTITGNGMLDMTDGDLGTADGAIDLLGNWINQVGPARFDEGNGVINFIGTSQQQIICNSLDEVFYTLTLNNAGGILLNDNTEISGNLTLTNGVITTGAKRIYISNTANTAIGVYSQTGFINGNLRRAFAVNTNVYPFPVGDGTSTTNYKRMDFINGSLNLSTATDYLDLYVKTITESGLNDDPYLVATQNATVLSELLENAVWVLEPSGTVSSGNWGTRLYVQNVSNLSSADDNQFTVLKRPTGSVLYSDWASYDATTTIPAAGLAGRIYDSGNGYAQKTGFTSFCELAIAKGATPLPIILKDFTAKFNGESVDLFWETASEINNDYFSIEKSSDGKDFLTIAKIEGAGYSSNNLSYYSEDKYPFPGTIYYRLRQTDYDGKESLSDIVSVFVGKNQNLSFFYKSQQEEMHIYSSLEGRAVLKISDMHGKVLFTENVMLEKGETIIPVSKSIVGNGIRIVSLLTDNSIESKRIYFE